MPSVDSWDPSATGLTAAHKDILDRASAGVSSESIELTEDDQAKLRPVVHLDMSDWQSFAQDESSGQIVTWIKTLTLIERDFSGFESGGKSPVLPLIALLKSRDDLPSELFDWIRAHTRNRFLPYGSLSDRL